MDQKRNDVEVIPQGLHKSPKVILAVQTHLIYFGLDCIRDRKERVLNHSRNESVGQAVAIIHDTGAFKIFCHFVVPTTSSHSYLSFFVGLIDVSSFKVETYSLLSFQIQDNNRLDFRKEEEVKRSTLLIMARRGSPSYISE